MKKVISIAGGLFFFTILLQAQTVIDVDSVYGIWTSDDSPYIITHDVLIPEDSSLIIEPGSEILFTGNYAFKVEGKISAVGNKTENIVFAFADSSVIKLYISQNDPNVPHIDGFRGIRFLNNLSENDTSFLVHCNIQNAKTLSGLGIDCIGGAIGILGYKNIVIKNCILSNNESHIGAAIYCDNSNPAIDGNLIEKNKSLSNGGAFYISNSNPLISNNIIRLNVSPEFGGAFYSINSEGSYINNTIAQNRARFGGAFSLENSDIKIINNTISDNIVSGNGGGLHCFHRSSPYIINSIIWGNTAEKGKQIYLYNQNYPDISYSMVQGGIENIGMFDNTSNQVTYSNNMDEDPSFVINDTNYYELSELSPCIDAGLNIDSISKDRKGLPRIINHSIDMGACEYTYNILISKQLTDVSKCIGEIVKLESAASGRHLQYQWQKNENDVAGENSGSMVFTASKMDEQGAYRCFIYNEVHTVYTNAANLVLNIPRLVDIGKDTNVFVNASCEIKSDASFDSYLWNTGETSQSISIIPSSAGTYRYWLTVKDENQCTSSDTIVVSSLVSSSGFVPVQLSFHIFPNPVSDILYISLLTDGRELCPVTIVDVSGKIMLNQVLEFTNVNDTQSLNISKLKNGVYLLTLYGQSYRFIKR